MFLLWTVDIALIHSSCLKMDLCHHGLQMGLGREPPVVERKTLLFLILCLCVSLMWSDGLMFSHVSVPAVLKDLNSSVDESPEPYYRCACGTSLIYFFKSQMR